MSKLWAFRDRLNLALSLKIRKIKIEVDIKSLVNILTKGAKSVL